jgi:uncharacterized membrane protein
VDGEARRGAYRRGGDGLEFDRFATFCDAIFAIAMTLLTLGIGVPALTDPTSSGELAQALRDRLPEVLSFVLSFVVIGYYWSAHHRFVAELAAIDRRLISLTLVYLLLIAFLPFPTALIGRYEGNAAAFAVYALSVGLISTMEWVLLRHAWRRHHLRRDLPAAVYRQVTVASLAPAALFVLSVPVAFASTRAAVLVWLLNVPAQALLARFGRPDADAYLE